MIRTIALLKWLTARLEALAALLASLNERIVTTAISATTEKLVAERQKVDIIDDAHVAQVDAAGEKLSQELKLAQARYSDTLQRIGRTTGKQYEQHSAKCKAIEAKRRALRTHITG